MFLFCLLERSYVSHEQDFRGPTNYRTAARGAHGPTGAYRGNIIIRINVGLFGMPNHGINSRVICKRMRMCGVDHIHAGTVVGTAAEWQAGRC